MTVEDERLASRAAPRGWRGAVSGKKAATAFFDNVVWFLLVVVSLIAGLMNSFFLTLPNLQNILVQATVLGFVSLAVAFALLIGEIDLSIVGTLVFSGVLGAMLMDRAGVNGLVAIVIVVACGTVIGLINGVCAAYLQMNSLIETLAMGLILGGAVLALTKSQTVSISSSSYLFIGTQQIGTWPVMPLALAVIYVLAWVLLTRTTLGRRIYAVGGNARAATAAGIRVKRVKLVAFTIGGTLSGAAGVLQTSYLGGVNSTVASTILLYAVAAPVIGGVSLQGGKGRVLGMLGGVLLITVIQVALQIVNISAYYVQIAGGAIIFVAVLLDSVRVRSNR